MTLPETAPLHVVLVQQRPARYYRRQGYSHRLVPLAQADRMSQDHAYDTARRVCGQVVAA